jgi:protein kinase-like protein
MPTLDPRPSHAPAKEVALTPGAHVIYVPGQIVAGRYRIIALLGRGGMGAVYRADDLKLGQPVSLKFLPPDLAARAGATEQFHAEVRNARQVSHPNVCRVYDIGEVEGHAFISMEYVDGEDLAALLRRIGRLPKTKADDVARQLCAGLAAAHDKGVLHRDLKPSNVMLDGNGRVRITDFGLALGAGEGTPGEVAGTPAYMAPEQFEGKPASVRSDLYSLGLVLYEIYTGRRALEASGYFEWKSRHAKTPPLPPGSVQPDVGDAAERVILRCLEKDPLRRPGSALQVAAALPGGDPLAAALAAGETPSPEMVAAAGGEGALSRRKAWTLLGAVVTMIAFVLAMAPYSTDLGLAPMTLSKDVLQERARAFVRGLGYDPRPNDSHAWLVRDYAPMRYFADRTPSTEWRREFRRWGPPVLLMYRQSPRLLVAEQYDLYRRGPRHPRVSVDDPPFNVSGMALAAIDGAGRLRQFQAVPPQIDSTSGPAMTADWNPLFAAAGLDRASFTETSPRWVPPVAFDSRSEWIGKATWFPSIPLRLSAAAWRGRPVYFEVLGPWSRPERDVEATQAPTVAIANMALGLGGLLLLGTGIYFARRNLRQGRGDRRGAWLLALLYCVGSMLRWLLDFHHVPDFGAEISGFFEAVGISIVAAGFLGTVYLALEPFMRRHIPELLIGWARVLEGRFHDPRVGRDLLIGACLGTFMASVAHLANALPTWFPLGAQTTIPSSPGPLTGGSLLLSYLLAAPMGAIVPGIFALGYFFVLLVLLRKRAAAVIGLILILTLGFVGGENFVLETAVAILLGTATALVTVRYGLLAVAAGSLFSNLLLASPLPLDFRTPYATQSAIAILVTLAIALYAFRIAIGSRPVFEMQLDAA